MLPVACCLLHIATGGGLFVRFEAEKPKDAGPLPELVNFAFANFKFEILPRFRGLFYIS